MSSEKTYMVWVCPDCLEQITEPDYTPAEGRVWGHYHDRPAGWPEGEPDPWFEAMEIEVAPIDDSFDGLKRVAQRILDYHYPAGVFTGESGTPGPRLVAALRAVTEAEADA